MRTNHQLVGYDRETERPVFTLIIPSTDPRVKPFLPFDEDDAEGAFSYRLEYPKVSDLAGIFDKRAPRNLEYFIEPYP